MNNPDGALPQKLAGIGPQNKQLGNLSSLFMSFGMLAHQ
jgi:hypothetical protein